MDSINFKINSDNLQIEDFPDAIAVVHLRESRKDNIKIRHLALHAYDLSEAKEALDAINKTVDPKIQNYLWEYAVVKVTKCFKRSNARNSLDYKTILNMNPLALNVIEYFLSLRDKFIVHDDNPYTECDLGLVITNEKKSYAVEKVITIVTYAVTLTQDNYNNLNTAITETLSWINKAYTQLTNDIYQHYESLGRNSLLELSAMEIKPKMSAEDVHKNKITTNALISKTPLKTS